MRNTLRLSLVSLCILWSLIFIPVAHAQEDTPTPGDFGLRLTTPFPSMEAGLDETIRMDLTLSAQGADQIVDLQVADLPEGWSASFRGGGRTVRSAYVEQGQETMIDLRLEPALDTEPGTYNLEVVASAGNLEARLPVELVVLERAPASLAFDVELPTLRGRPTTTFRYNVTLENEGDEDLVVDLFAQAPPAFRVTFQSGGQEVTSIPLGPNDSERLNVQAEPLVNTIPADRYPISLRAEGGEASATAELVAEIVGQSSLTLTTPDGRLSGRAEAGGETTFTLLIQNAGSAPAQGISMGASPPSGWEVEFDPEQIEAVEPGQQREITARVRPAEQALAGDYLITFRAQPENESAESIDYRVTVRTATLWGIVGIGLVAISVGVVGWAVARFGRR